ncbi:MAG: DUF1015 family protein [Acidimicrobiales bacterium]|jgi:uncharacterized protein (DUF1015 family)
MARLAAFRGTTYNTDLVDPDEVVAPPYDVVGPAERADLAARSTYNSILVELPEDPGGGDRYEHAARLWRRWHEDGAVEIAGKPTLYIYRMTFTEEDGSTRTTTGVMGALGLDSDHSGEVLPHEQTIPKDKHDRLSLLRAARTNFSPIWSLSLAEGLGGLCDAAAKTSGDAFRALDDAGVLHECWPTSDPDVLAEITSLVGSAPVLIADGHHRYETACAYSAEEPGSTGSDAVLALVVELSSDELAVQAIHRLLTGVDASDLVGQLAPSFEVTPGPSDAIELRDAMGAEGALGLLTPGHGYLLVPRPSLLRAEDDDLDSTRLARALESVPGVEVTYQHGALQAALAVTEGRAAAAVLLRPVSVQQIAGVAHGGRRMPPKSTFFYPKPRTGAVFRELDA